MHAEALRFDPRSSHDGVHPRHPSARSDEHLLSAYAGARAHAGEQLIRGLPRDHRLRRTEDRVCSSRQADPDLRQPLADGPERDLGHRLW